MDLDRIYILNPTDRNLELFRLDSGEIAIHTPALVSASDAQQIANGIFALLSGQFDRAISDQTLQFDLARRRPQSGSAPSSTQSPQQPELDSL